MARLIHLLVALVLALWASPVIAAPALVSAQQATALGDDQTLTLGSAVGASNHAYIFVGVAEGVTITITGTTMTWAEITGSPFSSAGFNRQINIWCAQGDGTDTTFTVTTSGANNAQSKIVEFSGASCTTQDIEQADDTESAAGTLDTDEAGSPLTLASEGVLFAFAWGDNMIAGTSGSWTLLTQGSMASGGVTYRIESVATTYNPSVLDTNDNCNDLVIGVIFSAGAGGGGASPKLLLLGVGE